VCDLALCRVLLMNNSQFPWLILVPMRDAVREMHALNDTDYTQLAQEIRHVSKVFSEHTNAFKMNVAALGNMVPQLHVHIIARFESDAAWPGPVWNSGAETRPYQPDALALKTKEIQVLLR
jgi:diadenosine tetraphosphate (Ap4A) HIT family hydrolase